jgi:hypothetical protein
MLERLELIAAVACGDLDLDLRQAAIDRPRTAATVLLAFGNIDVYVPEGVNVDVSGLTVFGHLRERGTTLARRTRRPFTSAQSAAARRWMYGGCRTTRTAATAISCARSNSASASFRLKTVSSVAGTAPGPANGLAR